MSDAYDESPIGNSSSDNNLIDTELQVRLMNLVMGEASDFERDQLQLLMEQRPELAPYCKHLEHLHGLLGDVGAGEPSFDIDLATADTEWRLPADRRERVVAVLENRIVNPPPKVTLANKRSLRNWRITTMEAIVVASVACVILGLMLPATQSAREAAAQLSFIEAARYQAVDLAPSSPPANRPVVGKALNAVLPSSESDAPNAATSDLFSHPSSFPGNGNAILKDNTESMSSSNGIAVAGQTLPSPYYLSDDVQYFPASPENKMATEPAASGTLDSLAVQKREQTSVEKQLGQSNFRRFDVDGRLAVDGEDQLDKHFIQPPASSPNFSDIAVLNTFGDTPPSVVVGQSGGVAGAAAPAFTTDLDFQIRNNFGVAPASGAPSSGKPEVSKQSDSPSSSFSAYRDSQNSIGGNESKVASSGIRNKPSESGQEDRVESSSKSNIESGQLLAQTDEEVWRKLGGRRLEGYGDIFENPKRRDQSVEGSKLDSTKSEKVTQGWVNRLFEHDVSNTSTLMMTVTPRIIIPEEEETMGAPSPSPELSSSDRVELKKDASPSASKQPVALDEQSAAAEAYSTFSLHVSDVSFKLAQAALSQSQWPEAAKIRIEEFVNALDYHDPLPSGDQKIACRVEQAIHPFLMQRNLLRVSMRTAAAGRSQNTPLRLTLLLDNSGSMERPDRRQAVLRAFQTLTQQLKATDQITLISFASSPRLLAEKVPGNQGETLLKLIEELPSEGGTNIESALQLAREKATEQQVAGAQNRIVLLTDGAVNLGDANPENLAKQVTQMRDAGIAFDSAGISAQDLNDEVLEALTRQGDGRYYLLDSAELASESFAAQIAGSLRPSAQNVKVQVEFNPQRVGRYKLLGYEKHRLNKEDFRNDQVDAAEMAAAEAGVAVYQYEIKPKGSGDVGSVSVRFRDLSTGQMVERRWPILYESNTPRLEQSQPSMQLAAAAALFAAKLGGGPLADSVDMAQLQKTVAKLPEQFASQPRVQQLRAMIEQAIAIQ